MNGAVIYLRTADSIHQLIAKSRIAPLSCISIPRLELKGAVLLADLIIQVKDSMPELNGFTTMCWCDSKVVLHWIHSDPAKWKPFIRNRTAMIREFTVPENFKESHCIWLLRKKECWKNCLIAYPPSPN